MAQALLHRIDSEHFEAISAGASHAEPHRMTVEVMNEIGLELDDRPGRVVEELAAEAFDYVITLDEGTASLSRHFPQAEAIHWKFDNPLELDTAEKQVRAFRAVRDQIAQRLRLFVIVETRSRSISAPAYSRMAAGSGR